MTKVKQIVNKKKSFSFTYIFFGRNHIKVEDKPSRYIRLLSTIKNLEVVND